MSVNFEYHNDKIRDRGFFKRNFLKLFGGKKVPMDGEIIFKGNLPYAVIISASHEQINDLSGL